MTSWSTCANKHPLDTIIVSCLNLSSWFLNKSEDIDCQVAFISLMNAFEEETLPTQNSL